MRELRFSAVVSLCFFCASCWFQKKHAIFIPPPPLAQPRIPTEVALLPSPPKIDGDPTALIPPVAPVSMPHLAPPAAAPATPRRTNPAPTHPTAPATAEQPVQPPKLGPMFTPDQRRELLRELDDHMEHVRRAIEILSAKNLNQAQIDDRNKITTFQKQAEQYRDQDLVSAVNLARRADLLAQDLLERVPQ
jgi:hypothetical protein